MAKFLMQWPMKVLSNMQHYGMYTKTGNRKIHHLVLEARAHGLSWQEVYDKLYEMSGQRGTEEATDTVVREYVYDACKFTGPFYI